VLVATTGTPSKVHLPALDGVRGLAILVVLVHNLSIFTAHETLADRLWTVVVESGWVGVQLFFVLSGFLITGILLDDEGRGIGAFYGRRMLRIGPLYYVGLLLYFFVAPRFAPSLARSFEEVIWYWLYLSNWSVLMWGILPGLGHVWSLAVEEQFYLIWPWVVGRASRRTFAWICVLVTIAALVFRIVLHARHFPDLWLYSSTVTRMDALAIGALVALAFRSETWRPRLERVILPLSIVVTMLLLALMAKTHGMNRNNPLVQIYGYSLIAILSAALVALAAAPRAPRVLSNRVLRFFGRYSYAIYLLHPPLKHIAYETWQETLERKLAESPVPTDALFIGALTVVTIPLALLSWHVLEKRALRLKDRWFPRAVTDAGRR
jgi:peptidoglycan/LPS O-acetylase OafA/YrhL